MTIQQWFFKGGGGGIWPFDGRTDGRMHGRTHARTDNVKTDHTKFAGGIKMQTRARSQWGAIANPHAKVFDSPQHPQVPPRGMTLATEWKFCSICFPSYICENTHKEFGIKIFEIDMLMIFDLLTLPQGHQFDPRMKMLLAFCSACHPRRFDMPHDHVRKKFFWPPRHPQCLKVPPLGHDPGDRIKIPSDMLCIYHLWEHTQSLE